MKTVTTSTVCLMMRNVQLILNLMSVILASSIELDLLVVLLMEIPSITYNSVNYVVTISSEP